MKINNKGSFGKKVILTMIVLEINFVKHLVLIYIYIYIYIYMIGFEK